MTLNSKVQTNHIRGYIEGYYGKLLSWNERTELVHTLASLQLNTYCYAPKEDPQHRLRWRESHNQQWHKAFKKLCATAESASVSIVAGIAPGLDFNFKTDFDHLHDKSQQYLNSGATRILLLWDDIDDEFSADVSISEGTAHARTVNQLSEALDQPIWTVPRVYADEIENKDDYLEDFFDELQSQHIVLLCGNAIVSSKVEQSDLTQLSRSAVQTTCTTETLTLKHQTVVWDNFYANDYCPRRLFIGPWNGRENVNDYLINPTGMPYTDKLLMDIATATHTATDKENAWIDALNRHRVPKAFLHIAPFFSNPCFGDKVIQSGSDCTQTTPSIDQAIEHCLWKWKSPLAREWYPFIMSLKHDLALVKGTLPTDRIIKTQTSSLSPHLLKCL